MILSAQKQAVEKLGRRRLGTLAWVAACAGVLLPVTIGGCSAREDEGESSALESNSDGPNVVISQVYAGGGLSCSAYQRDYVEIFNPSDKEQSLGGVSVQIASAKGELGVSARAVAPGRGLVISQIYSGGGVAGAVYHRDYVEIFNNSRTEQSTAGLALQFSDGAGEVGSGAVISLPAAVIPPGGYYSVGLGGVALPEGVGTGDAGVDAGPLPNGGPLSTDVGTALTGYNLPNDAGKVALVRGVQSTGEDGAVTYQHPRPGCGTAAARCTDNPRIVDLVGYGNIPSGLTGDAQTQAINAVTAKVSDFDGTVGPALGFLPGANVRNTAGCTDAKNNRGDFQTTSRPAPRTRQTAVAPCPSETMVETSVSLPATLVLAPGQFLILPLGSGIDPGGEPADVDEGVPAVPGALAFNPDPALYNLSTQGGKVALVFSKKKLATPSAPTCALTGTPAAGCIPIAARCGAEGNRCAASGVVDEDRTILDMVGWGSASDFKGAGPASAPDAHQSIMRQQRGCARAGSNAADFAVDVPVPRSGTAVRVGAQLDGQEFLGGCSAAAENGMLEPSSGLVLSQVYTAGGITGSEYDRDFVVLFNPTSKIQWTAGMALHYGANKTPIGVGTADGKIGNTVFAITPQAVNPGQYLSVGLGGPGEKGEPIGSYLNATVPVDTATLKPLPESLNLNEQGGTLALVRGTAQLHCRARPDRVVEDARIVDRVAYGDAEGSKVIPAPSPSQAAIRKDFGCRNTGDTSADFELEAPSLRFSGSALRNCETLEEYEWDAGVLPLPVHQDRSGPAPENTQSAQQTSSDVGCSMTNGQSRSEQGGFAVGALAALGLALARRKTSSRSNARQP